MTRVTITVSLADALQLALQHHQANRLTEAEEIYLQIVQAQPDHPETLHYLAVLAYQSGRPAQAVEWGDRVIAISPQTPYLYSNRGAAHWALGHAQEAIADYRQALHLQPNHLEACVNLGNALKRQEQWEEAIASYKRALAINPKGAGIYLDLGDILLAQGKAEEAIVCHRNALTLKPDYPEAYNCLGNAFQSLDKLDEAIACYQKALQIRPNFPDGYYNMGIVLQAQEKREEAIEAYRQALVHRPNFPQAYYNMASIFHSMEKTEEAIANYQKALALDPNYAKVLDTLGAVMQEQGKLEEAINYYRQACEKEPNNAGFLTRLMHLKRQFCEWQECRANDLHLQGLIEAGHNDAVPFSLTSLPVSPQAQRACAEHYVKTNIRVRENFSATHYQGPEPAKLKIGYLSGDWQDHPVALLLAETLELHDRQRFEIKAYSFGRDDGRKTRRRVMATCDSFTEIRHLSDLEAAQLIHNDGIHILVELMGFTVGTRMKIPAMRPAPIQATWLGYLGSVGAPFIDYLISDGFLTPPGSEPFYTEKLLRLPESFQPNDRTNPISPRTPTRQEFGLPEKGFLFASFNQTFKITPEIFDVWMSLLRQIPDSILWLVSSNRWVAENLRREAEDRGVDGHRLFFASYIPLADHLARYRLVDLALDPHPYGSGTTGSNCLWAGCPMITYAGQTFASRVAGSLLAAVGLPDMITSSLEEYEALALEMARYPKRLAAVRQRLQDNLPTAPLFDTPRFTKHLEMGYESMWQRYRAGLPPDHIDVPPIKPKRR